MRQLLGLLTVPLVLVTSLPGGSLPPDQAEAAQTTPRAVHPMFQPFYRGPIFPEAQLLKVRDALPYESVALELSGGMLVPSGHFRVSLFRDGRATLWNDSGSRLGDAGRHVGTANVFDYARICQLIFEGGLENLPPRYAVNFSDLGEMTVTVASGGRTFSVSDYGGAAPVQVWAIQRAIEAAGFRIRWKRE